MTVLVRSVYGSKVLGGYMYEQSRVDNKNQDILHLENSTRSIVSTYPSRKVLSRFVPDGDEEG